MSNTTKLRVLIVDDEPLVRKKIRGVLRLDPEVEISGECGNGSEALAAIAAQTPDLIFLDVQMPQLDGLAVSRLLKGVRAPLIIFVTAYDQYAVQAFQVRALDYLLKPFDQERLQEALQRAKEQWRTRQQSEIGQQVQALLAELKAKPKYLERLVVRTSGRILHLKTKDVDWIEAEGNYARLHIGKESHLLREAISNLEPQLDPAQFRRIHRSTIVRLDRIRELRPCFHGEYQVILHDGTEVIMSRNYREKLPELLGKS
jgi:two-component system, LytTR family, response regulator